MEIQISESTINYVNNNWKREFSPKSLLLETDDLVIDKAMQIIAETDKFNSRFNELLKQDQERLLALLVMGINEGPILCD